MIPEWGGLSGFAIDRIRARIKVRVERPEHGPWRRCITAPPAKEKAMTNQVIPEAAVEAAARAAYSIGKIDAGADWDELYPTLREVYVEMATLALEAAAPQLMAQAFDEGQKSGMRHADRLVAAAKIGKPELPGPISPNPYRTTNAV